MENNRNNPTGQPLHTKASEDLPDNEHDLERMQAESVTINLPDVRDIPGQENIVVPPLGELADTTISSDGEEGAGLFDDEEDDTEIMMGTEADVSAADFRTLEKMDIDMPTNDDIQLRAAELDQEDFEGSPLNEGSLATNISGSDLDEPGTESDDPMEAIGEEDEENNNYSLGNPDNDNVTEDTP
jgi:hypothetical protein